MPVSTRFWKAVFAGLLVVNTAACSAAQPSQDTSNDLSTVQEPAENTEVAIPTDSAAGAESQRIVDLLNAAEDTSAADWEAVLHPSFTAEVTVDELVELLNINLRPAQPFRVTDYSGADRQAVTILTSEVSAPMDMTVVVDPDGLITGLFFAPSNAPD